MFIRARVLFLESLQIVSSPEGLEYQWFKIPCKKWFASFLEMKNNHDQKHNFLSLNEAIHKSQWLFLKLFNINIHFSSLTFLTFTSIQHQRHAHFSVLSLYHSTPSNKFLFLSPCHEPPCKYTPFYILHLSFMCNLCTCRWCHINPSVKFTRTSAIYSLCFGKSPRFQTILANNQHHHQFTNVEIKLHLLNNQCVKEETKRKIKNITWCKLKWKHNIPKHMGYT